MARPRAALPGAEAILALVDGQGRLALRVTPGARVEALEIAEGRLLAKVRAPAEDGKANAAVVDLVARGMGLAPSRITLIKGATMRDKLLAVVL
jgi:uncharacterized protein YggU (UPF0235/DUF167 family)